MLEILKKRLPEGLEILAVKERSSKYDLVFGFEGEQAKAQLQKACAPGYAEANVDFTICLVMAGIYIQRGDYKNAKLWSDRQLRAVRREVR